MRRTFSSPSWVITTQWGGWFAVPYPGDHPGSPESHVVPHGGGCPGQRQSRQPQDHLQPFSWQTTNWGLAGSRCASRNQPVQDTSQVLGLMRGVTPAAVRVPQMSWWSEKELPTGAAATGAAAAIVAAAAAMSCLNMIGLEAVGVFPSIHLL